MSIIQSETYSQMSNFVLGEGRQGCTEWLRNRFQGDDGNFPIDHKFGEEPFYLVQEMLKEFGRNSEEHTIIGESLVRILNGEFEKDDPNEEIVHQVFRLCQGVTIVPCRPWFAEMLSEIAKNPEAAKKKYQDIRLPKELLRAARNQLRNSDYTELWKSLKDVPGFEGIATVALERDSGYSEKYRGVREALLTTEPADTGDRPKKEVIRCLKTNVPNFRPGDTVRVSVRIVGGDIERVQDFQGVVINRRGSGIRETFTVRRVSFGVGMLRTFQLHSPRIVGIKIVRRGKVRRAKLYYLRALSGKKTRLTERRVSEGKLQAEAASDKKSLLAQVENAEQSQASNDAQAPAEASAPESEAEPPGEEEKS